MSFLKIITCFFIAAFFITPKNAQAFYTYSYLENLSSRISAYDTPEWKNLLHYDDSESVINKDSPFFINDNGYKNPAAEYFTTLKGFFQNPDLADDHLICRYPARFNYMIRTLQLQKNQFRLPHCALYQEYQTKVPVDQVIIVFASENTTSPSSMMGHSFLKLSGSDRGKPKEHAFSYVARINASQQLSFYIDVMTRGTNGIYTLSPYKQKEDTYLHEEQRSLWEFEVNMTNTQKERLKEHLWELKEKNIRYSFISHNCNTALMSILKIANPDLEVKTAKPFMTPVEYIQSLHELNYITDISITPTAYTSRKIAQGRLGNILNAPKSSRISMAYEHLTNNYLNLEFSPVYQDIRNISNAYSDELESKIMEVDIGLNTHHAFIRSVDILRMKSILDYSLTHAFSKSFKLSFENNLGSEKSDLRPTIEFGMGYGYYAGRFAAYFIPKLGYRYHDYSNFYLAPEIGVITKLGKAAKIITSYSPYINSNDNNRGFNSELQLYGGYAIAQDNEVFTKYSHYTDAAQSDQIIIGFTRHF